MPRNRRRRSGSPVSFFAFQDIITAVSGIFIVILLVLTLELIQRPTLAQSVTVAVNSDLETSAEEARTELERLESVLDDSDQLIRELSELTPQETERQIRVVRRKIDELQQDLERLQEQRQQLAEAKKRVDVEHFDQKADREQLAELKRRIEELKRELDREQTTERPIFALPRGVTKQGWVVVVSGAVIQAAPMNRVQQPLSFTSDGKKLFSDSAVDQFIAWTHNRDAGSAYLLILVRPSGLKAFETLRPQLAINGILFGFDLVGTDETILDPVRGAVP